MDSSHGRIVQKDESMSTRKLVDIFLCENTDGSGRYLTIRKEYRNASR